jgi:polyisoprenyl-teichoic acid--peptidoglycan teichoic acid transferase
MGPPGGEKPYRLYRGGRVKGRVPTVERPARAPRPQADGRRRYRGPGPKPTARRPRKIRWRREIGIAIVLVLLFFIVWAVVGYLAFRSGVSDANKRLPRPARRALAPDRGTMFSNPSNILLLGTDHSLAVSHSGDRHADSITLLRTDPDHGRLYYLSIPRDLVVGIPGYGQYRINAATQLGGPRLAIRTVRAYTSLPINHVVIVNIPEFREVIDKVGGIDITVPRPILSKFECPYGSVARCERWPGWRFRAGRQHMNGRRAVIYARVRKNALGNDTDITRGERQQQVLQALMSKLASFSTFIRMPWIGGDLMKPLATDLSTNEFLELGWDKVRAGRTLHCRLGGTSTGGDITPSEDNAKVILMILGRSAPQPPAPSGDTYPPGCFIGNRLPGD